MGGERRETASYREVSVRRRVLNAMGPVLRIPGVGEVSYAP